jgi:hypothetical protein
MYENVMTPNMIGLKLSYARTIWQRNLADTTTMQCQSILQVTCPLLIVSLKPDFTISNTGQAASFFFSNLFHQLDMVRLSLCAAFETSMPYHWRTTMALSTLARVVCLVQVRGG